MRPEILIPEALIRNKIYFFQIKNLKEYVFAG